MRLLLDIGDTQIQTLDALSKRAKRSRVDLIRDAVGKYLTRRCAEQKPAEAFGLWATIR